MDTGLESTKAVWGQAKNCCKTNTAIVRAIVYMLKCSLRELKKSITVQTPVPSLPSVLNERQANATLCNRTKLPWVLCTSPKHRIQLISQPPHLQVFDNGLPIFGANCRLLRLAAIKRLIKCSSGSGESTSTWPISRALGGQVLVIKDSFMGEVQVSSAALGVSGISAAYLAMASGAGVLGTGVRMNCDHSMSSSSSSWLLPLSEGVCIQAVLCRRL